MKRGVIVMRETESLGAFLSEKRRDRQITSLQMSELVGISPGYYCDIEKCRRVPPDRAVLERIIEALQLSKEDRICFYDLAGKAKSAVSPDLPEYIMEHELVRVALRVAKEKANADDWKQFLCKLENK